MAQHDYTIANQSAPAARADINNALAAIVSQNSGTSSPSITYANMVWYDTANDILKMRNEADTDWITIATLDQAGGTSSAAVTIASQVEAQNGIDNAKMMTPLRVKEAITFNQIVGHLAVGSYAVLINNSGSAIAGGATVAGSSLRYQTALTPGVYGVIITTAGALGGTNATGTWQLMGANCPALQTVVDGEGVETSTWSAGLFLRIA
jgi:hypothetical protein